MIPAKDLSKEAPTSPRIRTGGYAILSRALDKGRSAIAGTVGEFHFDCPLDNYLFGFKGVQGSEIKELLAAGHTDGEIAAWLDSHGEPKTEEEKRLGPTASKRPAPMTFLKKRTGLSESARKPVAIPPPARFSISSKPTTRRVSRNNVDLLRREDSAPPANQRMRLRAPFFGHSPHGAGRRWLEPSS